MSEETVQEGAAAPKGVGDAQTQQKLGYDPGWTSATWLGSEPEEPPRATPLQQIGGWLRLIAFALITLLLMAPFFIARALGGRRDRAVAALWCRAGLAMTGLKVRQIGEPLATGGALLVNHTSWIDILLIGGRAPVHFVAKEEISGWPVFGWIGRISNTVFIARKRAEAKAQELLLARRAREGDLLCLFPEGTSSDGQRVLPFKSALFSLFFSRAAEETDARPLNAQPVSIFYAPPERLPRTFFGWWGRMALFGHMLAVCQMGGGVATLHFHAPLDPTAFPNRKALAAEAERLVRDGLEAAAARAEDLRA